MDAVVHVRNAKQTRVDIYNQNTNEPSSHFPTGCNICLNLSINVSVNFWACFALATRGYLSSMEYFLAKISIEIFPVELNPT